MFCHIVPLFIFGQSDFIMYYLWKLDNYKTYRCSYKSSSHIIYFIGLLWEENDTTNSTKNELELVHDRHAVNIY